MSDGDGPHLPVEITSETEEVIKELVRLEDARLERDNRQADIQEKALDVSNEQDKRHRRGIKSDNPHPIGCLRR